ncbi:MAG: restriction endonuclease subunit S [Verrucomicrobiota bacterium]
MSVPGWEITRLEQVTSKVGSGSTPRGGEVAYKKEGIPLVRSMNVIFFGFKRHGLAYIDDRQASALDNATVHSGDVLLNITGASIGRVTIAPRDMDGARVNQHVCIVRPIKDLDARFLNAFLSSPEAQRLIFDENYGVTRQALTKQQVLDFKVPLPPFAEQKRIADKLDAVLRRVDACHTRLDRVPNLLKRFRQSVLAAATSGQLTEEWRAENGGEEWQKKKLTELGELGRGKSKHRPRNDPRLYGGPYPFIQTGDVANSGGWIKSHSQAYSEFGLAQSKLWPAGTVCITIAANIADTAILSYDACFPDSVVGFVAHPNECLPEFVKWTVDVIKDDLEAYAPATAQKNINLGVLYEVDLSIPPLPEQQEIVCRVEALFALADRIEARLSSVQKTVDRLTPSVLAKAFRGELVPQDPNDEPASTLLERLRAERTLPARTPKPRKARAPKLPRVSKDKDAKVFSGKLVPQDPNNEPASILPEQQAGTTVPATLPKLPRAPKDKDAMKKSRFDDDVKGQPYLANLLRTSSKPLDAEKLFKDSELPLVDFYKQLAWEVEQGLIRDDKTKLEVA